MFFSYIKNMFLMFFIYKSMFLTSMEETKNYRPIGHKRKKRSNEFSC